MKSMDNLKNYKNQKVSKINMYEEVNLISKNYLFKDILSIIRR